jgi:hypothetical protein
VLFRGLALVEVVGFNAHQCENGLTTREESSRPTKKKQGPLTAHCLADTIWKITYEEMEWLFTIMVQWVARRGWCAGTVLMALDGRNMLPPECSEGRGTITQTRTVKVKGRKEAATEDKYVSGWNVLVLIEVHTRVPRAMTLVPIHESEGTWLVPLFEQAQRTLGTSAFLGTIVVDRGYLDGEDVWRVHHKGVIFVICGTSSMAVTHDMQGLANAERAVVRESVVRRGHGKTATDQRVRTDALREQKRRQARDTGRTLSERAVLLAGFHLLVTTLPQRQGPVALVLEL